MNSTSPTPNDNKLAQQTPARPPLKSLDDALLELLANASPLTSVEDVLLQLADGRVLGNDVVAQLDVPGFDNSSVDGYALNVADTSTALREGLPQSARIPAGHFSGNLAGGTVARIFTGAPIPVNANAVVMQEDCLVSPQPGGDVVRLTQAPTPGQNIRMRGEDIANGQVVVRKGTRLTPAHLGLLASIGQAHVSVLKPLRVALLSTGDELVMPGAVAADALPPGAIFSSNGFFLSTLLTRLGAHVTELAIVADTLADTQAALQHAANDHDLIVSTGGVSVGEEDHVKPAVQSLGSLDLWALAIKPGKPFAYGRINRLNAASCAHFVGLPGNPVSSFVTFVVLVRPFIDRLLGVSHAGVHALPMTAHFNWPKPDKRREFLRVKRNTLGGLDLYPNQSSGVLTSVSWADGFVDNPPSQSISRGDTVSFWPMSQCIA
ncbi:Molybdopterin molybdenumtransferase [Betaproteobacteria bacterium MOLA814]|jgi:molybdopterin molybdotransferase|nr:Molybdopterin molybdenumtransferase [Betaproteobacteria bacterium MOLA814]